jgi:hypothetical protein
MSRILLTTMLATLVVFTEAHGQPVQWDVNGHIYEAVSVPSGISWTGAADAAAAAGGHLATVTSADENSFIFSLIDDPVYWNQEPGGSNLGPWLGGYQTFDDGSMPDQNWRWVTPEPFDYTNWHPDEPNNWDGAAEDYLGYKCYGSPDCRADLWNDLPDTTSEFGTPVVAYVIEYDEFVPVPESGSFQNHLILIAPNPFNPQTTITFSLEKDERTKVSVYELTGKRVAVLADRTFTAGEHSLLWSGRDSHGHSMPSGTYIVRLES